MITEDYVSFETAKLLHSCGFWSDECVALYDCGNNNEFVRDDAIFQNGAEDYLEYVYGEEWRRFGYYLAPTLQMAMKWLREKHKLGVFPTTYYREMNGTVRHDYGSTIVHLDSFEIIGNDKNIDDYTFEADTYEETCEAAIKYCLENLI